MVFSVRQARETLLWRTGGPSWRFFAPTSPYEFDTELLAKMFANLAANGMTLGDLAGCEPHRPRDGDRNEANLHAASFFHLWTFVVSHVGTPESRLDDLAYFLGFLLSREPSPREVQLKEPRRQ